MCITGPAHWNSLSGPAHRRGSREAAWRPLVKGPWAGHCLPSLSSGSALFGFTCSYHHGIIFGLQAPVGSRLSSFPSWAGRGVQGPDETSAAGSHFCPQRFACRQLSSPGKGRGPELQVPCPPWPWARIPQGLSFCGSDFAQAGLGKGACRLRIGRVCVASRTQASRDQREQFS